MLQFKLHELLSYSNAMAAANEYCFLRTYEVYLLSEKSFHEYLPVAKWSVRRSQFDNN